MKKQVKKSGSLTKNVAQDGHGPWHPWASVGIRGPQDATGCHRMLQDSTGIRNLSERGCFASASTASFGAFKAK